MRCVAPGKKGVADTFGEPDAVPPLERDGLLLGERDGDEMITSMGFGLADEARSRLDEHSAPVRLGGRVDVLEGEGGGVAVLRVGGVGLGHPSSTIEFCLLAYLLQR